MYSAMETSNVLSRILDLVSTWSKDSPYFKSINQAMQNPMNWNLSPCKNNAIIQDKKINNWIGTQYNENQYSNTDNSSISARFTNEEYVNNMYADSHLVERRLFNDFFGNQVNKSPAMDRSYMNHHEREFVSCTEKYHNKNVDFATTC